MSLVDENNDWYRAMPNSAEFSNEDYYQYLPIDKVVAKVTKHQLSMFWCRSVGVFSANGNVYTLRDLNNSGIGIRVSLSFLKKSLPCMAMPFTVQLFGFAHWECEFGPTMYATLLKPITPPLALQMSHTMNWVVMNHLNNPEIPASWHEYLKK